MSDVKLCKDCRHALMGAYPAMWCDKVLKPDLVWGPQPSRCEDARDDGECGPAGNLWEAIPPRIAVQVKAADNAPPRRWWQFWGRK